jgi:hypothetical protein
MIDPALPDLVIRETMNPPAYNESPDEQDAGGTRKRRPPNLDNKKDGKAQEIDDAHPPWVPSNNGEMPPVMRQASPFNSPDFSRPAASAQGSRHLYRSPSSPGRTFYSPSPRVHSPASSQIFERNVQEDILPPQASPSIPSHITTENHIPPILGASSDAITDKRLDPDSVEIITHSMHQPAALTVVGIGTSNQSLTPSLHEDIGIHSIELEDSASNYGALDSADVRRLSFVSFADVVHAEHAESGGEQFGNKDPLHSLGYPGDSAAIAACNRSPSPLRSPVSSLGLGTSPPTSISPSSREVENSPNRHGRLSGSPLFLPPTYSPSMSNFYSELNVETMRQALKRTGSSDFGGTRSQPFSPVGDDDGIHDREIK